MKTKRRMQRIVSCLMVVAMVFAMQIIPFIPGLTANAIPSAENLWKYPKIELNKQEIYEGMAIPANAEMNAKFEFTKTGSAFPIEVFLPDGLYATAGEHTAKAFDSADKLVPGAKVVVDSKGIIKVYFKAPERTENDSQDNDDSLTTGEDDSENNDSETKDSGEGTTGSSEPDAQEPDASSNGSGNESTGSGNDSTGEESNSGPESDAGPAGNEPAGSEPTSSDENDADGSVSMFTNVGALTAYAFDKEADEDEDEKYKIKFEIPCYFDLEKLPTQPEEDVWSVEILNTVLKDDKYTGKLVRVELIPDEINAFVPMFVELDLPLGDLNEYVAEGTKAYTAVVNWNDNGSDKRPDWESFGLTLYYQTSSMGSPEPLTLEVLVEWGLDAEASADLPETPVPVRTGTTSNNWVFTYSGLPAQLRIVDDYDYEEEPPVPILGAALPITYSFKMNDEAGIRADYLVEETTGPDGYINTLKEVFIIKKEWKDYNNAYGTRASWQTLSENLNLSRICGVATESLGTLDSVSVPNATVTPSGTGSNIWTITITGIPAFNSGGIPYYYTVSETNDKINVAANPWSSEPAPYNEVYYEAFYGNSGSFAEETGKCFSGGTITNRLTGETEFDARKVWQDDGSVATRPNGKLLLYRYPNIPGRDYKTSSPVVGMEMDLIKAVDFDIDFSLLPGYPAEGLPRFDSEGQEYVYFVKELYPEGSGVYVGIPDYSASSVYVPSGAESTKGILYNSGVLNNRRVDTVDLSVTKTWIAAARQSMNASVTVLVERRLAGRTEFVSPFVSVDLTDVGGNAVGEFVIEGFRAEAMELTQSFSTLPKYDNEGCEYIYRITEKAITIAPSAAVDVTGSDKVVIDGYSYALETSPGTGIPGPGGNIQLTNRLIGETEVRIRKIWNGGNPEEWTRASFTIRPAGGALINPLDPTITIEMEKDGDTNVQADFYIDVDDSWQRTIPGGSFDEEGGWLVISGLPRYDSHGREIEYVVRENSVSGFYTNFGFSYRERLDGGVSGTERIREIQSTFTNTPTSSGGRHVWVTKEWADDGDLGCRGPVTMGLFYTDGAGGWLSTPVTTVTLNDGNDWTAFMRLSAELSPGVEDGNYNNYFVKEISVRRGADYYVDYESDAFPVAGLGADYGADRIATLKTNAHTYNVFAKVGLRTGASLSDPMFEAGENYRTSYTYRNVRTGIVEIDIKKVWKDDLHHEWEVPQEVQIEIQRRLNYSAFDSWDTLTAAADGFDGVVKLMWDGSAGSLRWSSSAQGWELPKYDKDGVLYRYSVAETFVNEYEKDGVTLVAKHAVGGGYALSDGHHYSVSVDADYDYGDHIPADSMPPPPRPDKYSYTVTNQRQETVHLEIYKLWHDVGRNTGTPGVDFNPALEARNRPDIYLILYETLNYTDKAPVTREVLQYVRHFWSTTGTNNEYYWKCTFDSLPRYTSDGVEIIYSVAEAMPNQSGSEYVTEYWNTHTPPAKVDSLDHVTSVNIYDVPAGATDVTSVGRVYNDGIIVNRREAVRTLSGLKVWKNIPGALSLDGYPTIDIVLKQDEVHDGSYVDVPNFAPVILEKGATEFEFASSVPGEVLPKYDKYGIFNRYRAEELGLPPAGYLSPKYNDYLMEITNEYNVNGTEVTVAVQKKWNIAPYPSMPAGMAPTATIELWRVLTDGSGDVPGTDIKIGAAEIDYSTLLERYVFKASDLGYNLPSVEGNKLLKIGYNGHPYRYYLKENLDGYTFSPVLKDDESETPADFYFEAENKYDGSSDIGMDSLVRLHGSKIWASDNGNVTTTSVGNRFGTRPADVELKVYRAVEGKPGTLIEITDSVDIVWIESGTTANTWTYTVNAKLPGSQKTPVGEAPKVSGAPNESTLYRYSLTGEKYIYYVEEVSVNHHYAIEAVSPGAVITTDVPENMRLQATVSGSALVASFRNRLHTVNSTVQKSWMKDLGAFGNVAMEPSEFALMLPDSLTFKLEFREGEGELWRDFKDASGTVVTITRSKAQILDALNTSGTNQMPVTFTFLPKYGDDIDAIRQYRLIETGIGAFAVTGSIAGGFTVSDNSGAIVKNTLTTIPLTIKKIWEDEDNRDGVRPASVTFKIVRDGSLTQVMEVTLNATEQESGKTFYVPKYQANGVALSTYTVEELIGDSFTRSQYTMSGINPAGSYILGDPHPALEGAKAFTFTNSHGQIQVSLTVSKNWSDAGIAASIGADKQALTRPAPQQIYVTIQRSLDGSTWTNMTKAEDQLGLLQEPTVALSDGNGWTNTWTGLTARYNEGTRYQYRIVETDSLGTAKKLNGYTATYRIGIAGSGAYSTTPASVTELNIASGIALQNRLDTVKLDVEKVWRTGGSEFARTATVVVQLYYRLEGAPSWTKATGTSVTRTISGAPWTAEFTNLPKENNAGVAYQYTVREVSVGGVPVTDTELPYSYSSVITDPSGSSPAKAIVTNTLETRNDITVKKVWDDSNNIDSVRPASVQLRLIKDMGEAFSITSALVTLNAANSWSYDFENLPKYRPDGETLSIYHVQEVSVSGHDSPKYQVGGGAFTEGIAGTGAYAGTFVSEPVPDTDGIIVNVKNTYTPTVDVTTVKVWDDHGNVYGMRPSELTFTLQRRIGSSSFVNVTDSSSAVITKDLSVDTRVGGAADTQEVKFEDLPKYNSSWDLWEYRVLETAAGVVPLVQDAVDDTCGMIGDTAVAHYEFSSLTEAVTDGFKTTVTNTLVMETISISGAKTWDDGSDRYGFRPESLELEVYYLEAGSWIQVDENDYTIVWTKIDDVWSYSITGYGLIRYQPGTLDVREYCVREIMPLSELYEADIENIPLGGPENSTTGERDSTPGSDNIINASFTNSLTDDTTSLWVHKETDYGPKTIEFTFRVYFSNDPITSANPGTLYRNHYYDVFNGEFGDYISGTSTLTRVITSNGDIKITSGQSFLLESLPQELYFRVVEVEHPDYVLRDGIVMSGQLRDDDQPVVVNVFNEALKEVSIKNTTENCAIGTPNSLTNAGGVVTVEVFSGQMPDCRDSDEDVRDALAVLWEPEGYWMLGDSFTINYIEFNETALKKINVWNYRNSDGTLRALGECSTDDAAALQRFIDAGAKLQACGSAVRLVLCETVEDMPRYVLVEVQFIPTIAVNNVTQENSGGNVKVIGGNLNSNSDGVPCHGGVPYVSNAVYGVAEPGYQVDMEYVAVRNLNDVDGEYVLLVPDGSGRFSAQLKTMIAGRSETVEISGTITIASILIEFDSLPVPLQADIHFVPDIPAGEHIDNIISNRDNNGGLPRTGVESLIVTLLLGLLTSLTATAAIFIVIRRQNLKDKRG